MRKENVRHGECVDAQYVASRMYIDIRTLYNKTSKGELDLPPSFKLGRRRLYDKEAFEKWFESKKNESQ